MDNSAKISNLKSSPLFNLSLVNKELFHSNFLAWFGREYDLLFKNLICGIGDDKCLEWSKDLNGFSICREYKHFDLCVIDNNQNLRLIIENKVKSVPTKKQLKEYEEVIIKNYKDIESVVFILLTMSKELQDEYDPNIQLKFNWKRVTYTELSANLRKLADKINNDYHKSLVVDYCNYVSNLQEIIADTANDNNFFYDSPKTTLMHELGIHDICGKRKIQSVYNKLIDKIQRSQFEIVAKDELESGAKKVRILWGYTDQPIIEVRFKVNDDYLIIQIQGSQYRHAIEFFDKEIGERICQNEKKAFIPSDKGLAYLKKEYNNILFSQEALNNFPKFLGNIPNEFGQNKKDGKKENGYCKYCNGKKMEDGTISCFVYQWVKIPNSISIDDLTDKIISDTNDLFDITHSTQ